MIEVNRIFETDIDEDDKHRVYIYKSDWRELNAMKVDPSETFASVVHHVLAYYVEYLKKTQNQTKEK